MKRWQPYAALVFCLGAALSAASGCELIASADRSLIGAAGAGGGQGGAGGAGGEEPMTTGGGMAGMAGMGGSGGMLSTNGTPCTAAGECQSGFCVDGVCCDTACDGTCVACTAALKGIGNDGACEPIVGGNDPQDECADETGTNACGQNGNCDGVGACQFVAVNTTCGTPAGCVSGVENEGDICDGAGTCMAGNTTTCDPYVCDAAGALCLVTCASSTDCLSTHFCAGNTCVMDKPMGQACAAADECQSGFCVDGFCCNTACNGLCQACAAAMTPSPNGTCANIDAGTDPGTECADPSECVLSVCNAGACANQNAPNGSACTMGGTTCMNGTCTP